MNKKLTDVIDESFDSQNHYLVCEAPYVAALNYPDDTAPAYRSAAPSSISVPVNKPGNLDKHYKKAYHGEQ